MAMHGRNKSWKEHFLKHLCLPVTSDRQAVENGADSVPFRLCLKTMDGTLSNSNNGETIYQLRVSLYDSTYKQFFGRTWVGPSVKPKRVGQKSRLNYNQSIYFHTAIQDPGLVLVFEVVAITTASSEQEQDVGVGWGFHYIFDLNRKLVDHSSSAPAPSQIIELYHGSPRALLFMEEPLDEDPSLTLVNGCQISVTFETHSMLKKALHLIPENTLIGHNDVLPGLNEPRRGSSVSANAVLDPFRKPRLIRKFPSFLERIEITLPPSLEKFEEDLCQQINEDRINRENKVADGATYVITERRLQIGIHNGWCYINAPEVVHLNADSGKRGGSFRRPSVLGRTSASANSLCHKGKIELEGLIEDPMCTVVFMLEYILTENAAATTAKEKRVNNTTCNVAVRWAAWNPIANLDDTQHKVQFIGGPSINPDLMFLFSNSSNAPGSTASISGSSTVAITFNFIRDIPSRPPSLRGSEDVRRDSATNSLMARPPSMPSLAGTDVGSSILHELPIKGSSKRRSSTAPLPPAPDGHYLVPPLYPPGSAPSPMPIGYSLPVSPHTGTSGTQFYTQTPRGPVGPMEILHHRDYASGSLPVSSRMSPDLQELPYTPVHAPIMATAPGIQSGQCLSRAAYAKLYTAGFPQILDNKGEAPEVIDPNDMMNIVYAKEEADKLKTNEIYLQFLAYSRMLNFQSSDQSKQPSTVFFTLQFYRFPQITTERLLLGNVEGELSADPKSLPCILQRLDKDGSVLKSPPGYQLKYHMDPVYMQQGEPRLFIDHLTKQTLHIDVWDGDSLLLIGSCAVELMHLCRQGREAIQLTYELDVVSTEYQEHDHTSVPAGGLESVATHLPVDVSSLIKGRLHLRLANVGHPPDPSLNKADIHNLAIGKPKKVVDSDKDSNSQFLGGSLNAAISHLNALKKQNQRVSKAKHMTHTDQELASVLLSRSVNSDSPAMETNAARKRKMARMEAIRTQNQEEKPQILGTYRKEKEIRGRDLRTIEMYRTQNKREGILNMLNQSITTDHTINASFGSCEFFEFALRNPYNTQHTITIECDHPELFVITDASEWRHFKMLHEVYTPLEEKMFNLTTSSGYPEVFLRPKEKVHIPFKFLTFKTDQTVPSQSPNNPYQSEQKSYPKKKNTSMDSKIIKVYFKTEQNKPIAILLLQVEPYPHIIDQTFRFHHPEQSFLKKSIRLPSPPNQLFTPGGPNVSGHVYVRCSDANVICESKLVPQGEPRDVFVKVACGASPQVKRFFLAVYTDPYFSRPYQIWQFMVHSLQRVDVSCVEGQTSRFTLLLRGTQASRLVQCYPSHTSEMSVQPSEPFMLTANTLKELYVGVRPQQAGCRFIYINVVDVEYHQLICTWLVCISCRAPVVSKAYELELPVGGGKGSNKRIAYTNPYPHRKVFIVRSNRDDLLQFKESRLEIDAGESKNIGLRFAPCTKSGTVEIMLFINDEDDKNEETFSVRATYS